MAGEIQAGMTEHWREGDIVVSVPGKSGTTWTMNIVHQLRTKVRRAATHNDRPRPPATAPHDHPL